MPTPNDRQSLLEDICSQAARAAQSGFGRPRLVRISVGDTSVEIDWGESDNPPTASSGGMEGSAEAEKPSDSFTIDAPIVGTFYRASEPEANPFVEIGDVVKSGQPVAILEAMKLMNQIDADRTGRVVDICVANEESVEYGQPLFMLVPVEDE